MRTDHREVLDHVSTLTDLKNHCRADELMDCMWVCWNRWVSWTVIKELEGAASSFLQPSPPRPSHLRAESPGQKVWSCHGFVSSSCVSFIYPFCRGHTCTCRSQPPPAKPPPLTSHLPLPSRSVLEIETSIKTERWYHFQGHGQKGWRREKQKTKNAQSTEKRNSKQKE